MANGRGVLWWAMLLAVAGCNPGRRVMKDTTPHGCAECHVQITRQWEQSAHATAWTSPAFVEATRGQQAEACLPCHAAQPLLEQAPGDEPRLRAAGHSWGVDCNTCHQIGAAHAGPYRGLIQPHPTVQDTLRLPCADFCGTCHRRELEQYPGQYLPSLGTAAGPSCSGCHMPAYRARLTEGHLLSYIHPKRMVRDHSFPVWTDQVSGGAVQVLELTAARQPGGSLTVAARLLNCGAGHEIPTGQFGYRELLISVQAVAEDGSLAAEDEQSVFPGGQDALRPGQAAAFDWVLVPRQPAVAIRLLVERVDEPRAFRYRLAHAEAPVVRSGQTAISPSAPVGPH